MDSRWCPIFFTALAVSLCSSPVLADRKFGCLFQDELCEPYEFCVNDGVFGRCQQLAGADLHTYDISASALQRLRIILQKLAQRGLKWEDDTTQRVISRELSKLRNVPFHHQSNSPSLLDIYSNSRDRKLKPDQTDLNRNLQKYLTEFLQPLDHQAPVQQEGPKVQNEDMVSDALSAPGRPKPKQGWKETTIYSLQKGAGQPPVSKVITKSGEGRHPKLSTAYSIQDPHSSKHISNHLEQLLTGASGKQQGDGEAVWPKGKLQYLGYLRPAQSNQAEPQTSAFGSKTSKLDLDGLLFKAGSDRLAAKKPLDGTNERLVSNAVNQLGRHSFNMEDLIGKDLHHLAEVITGALQEVDEERPELGARPASGASGSRGEMEANHEQLMAKLLNPDQALKSEKGQDPNQKNTLGTKQGQQTGGSDKESTDKQHGLFFSKLLDYLNMEPFGDAPGLDRVSPGLVHKTAGLENVQSRTTQGQAPVPNRSEEKTLTVPAKEGSVLRLMGGAEMPDAQVDSEMERWMQADQAPVERKKPVEPQKADMKIKTQLVHVGVKEFSSRGKDRHFGYIITGSDSLTNDQGLELMERLTQRLSLHASDLTQLSVLGPALTFRVGPNPRNVTTADLVQLAGAEGIKAV